jgi:hypothetical protein
MRYTLITAAGKNMEFHVKECAKLFQAIFGGVIEEVYDGRVEYS